MFFELFLQHLKKDSGNAIESHLRKGNADDQPRVSSEDQKDINLFGKSNARLQDLKDEIRAKEEEVQNLDDAVLEVEGCFEDDSCRFVLFATLLFMLESKLAKYTFK